MIRAFLLLTLALGLSALATWYFGADVIIALGLILVQLKALAKKVTMIEWPVVLQWLKMQAEAFFRIELLKKWVTTVMVPMLFGRAFARRIKAVIGGYLGAVRASFDAMMRWFHQLGPVEKTLAWIGVLAVTLALSVTGLGLWLVLFSVQLPFWLVAGAAAFGKMMVTSTQKSLFKIVAFLQLAWLWRGLRRLLPPRWLEAKRRFDFRVARAVVRRRRLTVRQVAERKDRLPFRIGVLIEYLFVPAKR